MAMMPARRVTLIVDETSYTEIDFPERPCVDGEWVNLIPGERIVLEADVQGDALVNLRHVETPEHPSQTITLELTQNQDRKSPFMILRIDHAFTKALTYEVGIQPLGEQRFVKTTSLPAPPGVTGYESWPRPLTRILLRSFRLSRS
jgi:hypothetical protein